MGIREGITLFVGPMRSSKSHNLLLQLEKLKYSKVPYIVFAPNLGRYENAISSRYDGRATDAIVIDTKNPKAILEKINLKEIKLPFVIAIDEVQFFDKSIVDVVVELNSKGIGFVISGLDVDANNKPFGPVGDLLAVATKVKKLTAACEVCGDPAVKTGLKKFDPNFEKNNIKIGDAETFIVLCNRCYYKNKESL